MRLTATVTCERGRAVRIFGIKQDITEEKAAMERPRLRAEFDALTGLANRSRFEDRLAALAAAGTMADRAGALMLIDLDGFKQVNDRFGHTAGDACLVEAARRLADACRGTDLAARIGGDEFAVLLGAADARGATATARQVVRALSEPMRSGDASFRIGVAAGLAAIAGCAPAVANADSALYAAKAAGRNTVRTFGTFAAARIMAEG